ncbi:hypothetical protein GOP47_0027831 [Adiantum capillus-veneris]|nr:hypothetical protein GOP47_0027831 [Adiantum capillus-veneris]
MMITTWSDGDKLQDDIGIDSSVMPSPAAASSFTSQVALAPYQTPISGNRAGDRALTSLWIRRLKPRDEPEGCNEEKPSSTEKKHRMISKEQEINATEKEQSVRGHGRGNVISSHVSLNSTGFERIQGATPERPTMSSTNSRHTSGVLQTSSRAVEGRISVAHGAQVEGSSFLGRPPLPRVHGKCGFPPRYPGYISQGFSSSPACKLSSSATDGGMFAMAPRTTTSNSKDPLLTVNILKGPLSKKGHPAQFALDQVQNALDHGTEEELTMNGKFGMTQATEVTTNGKFRMTQATPISALNPTKQCGSQGSNGMTVTILETSILKNQTGLETTKLDGVKVQSAHRGGELLGSFFTERITSKPTIDCRERSPKVEASPSASNVATFPWEMFAEPGQPSKSARQEFVEVYNRARNELKNQKASSLVTKVADNDTESCAGLTSRGGTYVQSTSTALHEGQNSVKGFQPRILEKLEPVSQPELLPKRQHRASFLEGEVTKKISQAYGGIHVASGKDSSSVLHSHGGAFHRYADPSSVALRDCHATMGESSSFRPGFAKSRARPEQCNQTLSQPKLSSKTNVKVMDIKAPMLLSKRQAGYFDGSPAVVTDKESGKQCENSSSRSDVWLQRWYPSQRNSQERTPLKLDLHEPDLAGRFKVLTEATERDNYVAYREERDSKKRLIEKGIFLQRVVGEATEPESRKPCSGKALPSAAAMAIAGSAAHQFCTMQRQGKRDSFAFWSGFGAPGSQASKSFAERGQKGHLSESEPSSKC